jgi:hypothetical protein
MHHGFQNFPMSARNQTHGAENFQNGDFGFGVFHGQALSYDVDGRWVS